MGSLGEAVLDIVGDYSRLKGDFEKAHSVALENTKKIGASMTKVGAGLTAGVTLPLIGLAAGTVKMASDLGESVNAVNVVFGTASESILAFGETAATAVGLSNREFNGLATTTGAFLQNVGFDAQGAADQTILLTKRAADMASVFNTDVNTALGAIQSGLKGEFNPLEQFGVKMNAAAITARALEMGLAGSEKELTDSHKATAALALMFEQTAKLEGDFINTQDSLANSTKIAKAELTDAGAQMGTMLLPIATQIVGVVRDLVSHFTNLSPETQKVILIVGGLAAALGPLLVVVGSVISAMATIAPVIGGITAAMTFPLIAIIAAVIAVVALLFLAWKNNFGGIQEKTAAVIAFITNGVRTFLAQIQAWWAEHGAQVMAVVGAFWGMIQETVQRVTGIVTSIVKAFQAAFRGDWTAFGTYLREAWDKTWQWIKDGVENAKQVILDILPKIITAVKDFFTNTDWKKVGTDIVKGIANGITSAVDWIVKAAENVGKAAIKAIRAFLGMKSPSTVFAGIGKDMMAGMALGIDRNAFLPVLATSNAARASMGAGITNTYNLTAQYGYQSEGSLLDQVRMLNMLGGG